jgi:AcrR family transcriptional regulator
MPKQTFFNLSADKREAILNIAIDEFAGNDYDNASISRVVAQAGIAKGSFYQYFEDKKDLFLYLMELATQEKLSFLRGQEPPDPNMGLFDYLRWLFTVGVTFQFSRPRLSQVAYRALYSSSPVRDDTLQQMRAAANDYYRQLIRMGIAHGDVDPEIDPDLAAFVLGTLLNEFGNYLVPRLGISMKTLAEQGAREVDVGAMERAVDELLRVLRQGLAGRSAAKEEMEHR